MRKLFLFSLIIFSPWSQAKSQPAQFFFGGGGKDQIAQIIRTSDGNLLATGAKMVGNNRQVWLLKLSQAGGLIWEKTYVPPTTNMDGFGHKLVLLPDGSLIILGEQRSMATFSNSTGIAVKTDALGNEIWKRAYTGTSAIFDATPNGNNLLLVGWNDNTGSHDSGIAMRIDANGMLQWRQEINVSSQAKVRRIFPTIDGNYLLLGRANVIGAGFQGIFLRKIKPDGTQIWETTFDAKWREGQFSSNSDFYNQSLGADVLPDGSIWVVNPLGPDGDVALLQFSAEGDLLHQKNYGGPAHKERPYGLVALPDGDWLITGEALGTPNGTADFQGFAIRIDGNGFELWRQYYGANNTTDRLFGGVSLDNGHLMLAGMSDNSAGNGNIDGWVLLAEPDGNALPWTIEGQIILDLNNNCTADAGEPVAKGWFVEAADTMNRRLVITDEHGKFKLRTDDGMTTLTAFAPAPSEIWQFCNGSQQVNSSSSNPMTQLTFLAQTTDGGCPHTEVSITQPDLVRCSTSTFMVTVQNRGAGESDKLLLRLVTDPDLNIISASEPYFQVDNSIEFDIEPMGIFQQKTIEIHAKLSCDVQIGATHGLFARLMPVACMANWSGPRFEAEGVCSGGAVLFSLKNKGGGGANALTRYRVLADGLLHSDWTNVTLPQGAAPVSLAFPANGQTWRIEVEQAPGFPSDSHPAVSIEGCGRGNNGLHAIAFRNAWRFDDGMPEVAAALAPNTTGAPDKIAEALQGFGLYNFVDGTDWLEYTARVRNPLNAPAESVEFRFSFSPNLDIRSFQVVASNGPVELGLGNNGVLSAAMRGIQIGAGDFAMLRFRILPMAESPADSGQSSLFLVDADVYVGGLGPYRLASGFNNYSQSFPNPVDAYNNYPPDIFLFGGRSYDFGTAMALAPDGSAFLVGESSSYSNRTNTDGFIVKTNAKGQADWLNAIDLGDQGLNTFKGVAPTADGGCIVVGNYRSPTVSDNSLSNYYAYLARIDANGRMIWHKKFRPAGQQYGAWVNGAVPAQNGQIIMFGYAENEINGSDQFYLKLDDNGNVIWQQYEKITGSAFRPTAVAPTSDGGFVFMGANESTVLNFDVYLEKIDADGKKLWSNGYKSTNGVEWGGIALMPDGGFLVGGYSQWSLPTNEYFIAPTFIRFSPQGNFQWEKSHVIGPSNIACVYNVAAAPDGGFFAVGEVHMGSNARGDILLLRLDENADTLWWRNYGSNNTEWVRAAPVVASNQIWLWGYNQPTPPLYDLQSVLVRTDLSGNIYVGTKPEHLSLMTNVSVFPNPANTQVQVSLQHNPTSSTIPWQLCDLRGLQVRRGISAAGGFDINLEGLPTGMYVLTFPGQALPAKRVIVMR